MVQFRRVKEIPHDKGAGPLGRTVLDGEPYGPAIEALSLRLEHVDTIVSSDAGGSCYLCPINSFRDERAGGDTRAIDHYLHRIALRSHDNYST